MIYLLSGNSSVVILNTKAGVQDLSYRQCRLVGSLTDDPNEVLARIFQVEVC